MGGDCLGKGKRKKNGSRMSVIQQRKRKRGTQDKTLQESELEQFIFGSTSSVPTEEIVAEKPTSEFVTYQDDSSSDSEEVTVKKRQKTEETAPAWHDEDDDDLAVNLKSRQQWKDEEDETTKDAKDLQKKLREHHAHLNTNLTWAQIDEEEGF